MGYKTGKNHALSKVSRECALNRTVNSSLVVAEFRPTAVRVAIFEERLYWTEGGGRTL